MRLIALLVGSYALGCLVAAYYLTRWRYGVDIRAAGSGNAGARNMARVYGMPYALITFFLDAAKGTIVVTAGTALVGQDWAGLAALLAAMIGHIWPAQLSFRGGKGVATGLGGMLFLDPLATLSLIGGGVVVFAITRNFFRSGLVVISLTAPVIAWFGHGWATVALSAATSLLCLVVNHPAIDAPRIPKPSVQHLPD
jgi:acyl-phosphate glycerol 3-phosphate acyltransferase